MDLDVYVCGYTEISILTALQRRIFTAFRGRKQMFYLKTYSTHFIYGYMASDIWYIVRGALA